MVAASCTECTEKARENEARDACKVLNWREKEWSALEDDFRTLLAETNLASIPITR
jgi:LmbE family N-acetylglucosaminyl deacetylase